MERVLENEEKLGKIVVSELIEKFNKKKRFLLVKHEKFMQRFITFFFIVI